MFFYNCFVFIYSTVAGRRSEINLIVIVASVAHSKLDYCNSLYYNLPKSNISPPTDEELSCTYCIVKAPKSSHITPILRSLHWLKINERIECILLSPIRFSRPANLTTYTILSLFSLQVELAPRLLSP